jgi:hypothetical protein
MKRRRNNLCHVHRNGASPGMAIPYHEECRRCVELRGHLPPDKRDVPGLAPTGRLNGEEHARIARLAAWRRGAGLP